MQNQVGEIGFFALITPRSKWIRRVGRVQDLDDHLWLYTQGLVYVSEVSNLNPLR